MATELLSLADAKTHLRVPDDSEDNDIMSKIGAATNLVEQHLETYIIDRTGLEYMPTGVYPSGQMRVILPFRGIGAVTQIEYWPPGTHVSENPTTIIPLFQVPPLRTTKTNDGRFIIYPPRDGWPDSNPAAPYTFTINVGTPDADILPIWREMAKIWLDVLYKDGNPLDTRTLRAIDSLSANFQSYA